MVFDGFCDVFERKVELLGAQDDGFEVLLKELGDGAAGAFGGLGDSIANAWHAFDQSFIAQCNKGFLHGVRIDLVLGAERSDRRENVSGLEFTSDDRLARGIENLFVNRNAGLELDR